MRPHDDPGARRQGRYVLGELLGRGGMAEVFAGNSMGSHGFQKPVAIKRLLPELSNDEVFVERLIGEAKLLVGMAHGNIVSVLDLARDGDDVFLVMEFVDGPSLRQLMKARGDRGVPLGVATYIVQGAAAGLEFAHGRPGGGVIHADISPSNILLTTSGEVRVADFGIARRTGEGVGIVEGKWAYMAPEQARGEALTPRSDVFALGVVLYELICGEHPLGRQVTAGERELEPKKIVPPRVLKPAIPAGIDAVCMKALAYEPRDRYARMQQVIDALVDERFANGWREGANDLATLIREIQLGSGPPKEHTQHTNRPVTIVTRSLISQQLAQQQAAAAAAARGSSPSGAGMGASASASASAASAPSAPRSKSASKPGSRPSAQIVDDEDVPKLFDSAARTTAISLEDAQAAIRVRPDSTPAPGAINAALGAHGAALGSASQPALPPAGAYGLSPDMLPAPELSSVHGGSFTSTGSGHIAAEPAVRSYKWAAGVLACAAIAGAIAAVVMSLGGDDSGTPFAIPKLPEIAQKSQLDNVPEIHLPPAATQPAQQAVAPVAQPAAAPTAPVAEPPPPVPAPPPAPPVIGGTTVAAAAGTSFPQPPVADVGSGSEADELKPGPRAHRNALGHVTASPAVAHKGPAGTLIFDTEQSWVTVTIDGQNKSTPGAHFHLAAGTYSARIKGNGESFTCKVTVEPEGVQHVNVTTDDRTCDTD